MAINLEKGQRINLEKSNGTKLNNICVGVNWGAIESKGLFGPRKKPLTWMPAAPYMMLTKRTLMRSTSVKNVPMIMPFSTAATT